MGDIICTSVPGKIKAMKFLNCLLLFGALTSVAAVKQEDRPMNSMGLNIL